MSYNWHNNVQNLANNVLIYLAMFQITSKLPCQNVNAFVLIVIFFNLSEWEKQICKHGMNGSL